MSLSHESRMEADVSDEPSQDCASVFSLTKTTAAYNANANKRLAGFMSQDSDLWMFQRFDRLNLFNIIALQQHLADLEQRLDQLVPDNVQKFDEKEFEDLKDDIQSSLKKYGMTNTLSIPKYKFSYPFKRMR